MENKKVKTITNQEANFRALEKKDLKEINFKDRLYVLQDRHLFYILSEVSFEKFIFICFTENDFAMGNNDNSFPSSAGYYESAEAAIADLRGVFNIYEFETRREYALWLISKLKENIEFCVGNFDD